MEEDDTVASLTKQQKLQNSTIDRDVTLYLEKIIYKTETDFCNETTEEDGYVVDGKTGVTGLTGITGITGIQLSPSNKIGFKIFKITVAPKPNGGNQYLINGRPRGPIRVMSGFKYLIDVSDVNTNHPFKISTVDDGRENGVVSIDKLLVDNVKQVTAFGQTMLEFTPKKEQVGIPLYYFCENHPGMGSTISVFEKISPPGPAMTGVTGVTGMTGFTGVKYEKCRVDLGMKVTLEEIKNGQVIIPLQTPEKIKGAIVVVSQIRVGKFNIFKGGRKLVIKIDLNENLEDGSVIDFKLNKNFIKVRDGKIDFKPSIKEIKTRAKFE